MARQSTTVGGMLSAVGQFQTAISDAQAKYTMMQNAHDTLSSSWQGTAAATFTSGLETWLSDFSTVISALQDMSSMLANNGKVVDQAHQDTSQQAQQTAGMLAGFH
ncbi:WXG100 family type VII secretion target [Streptomyces sp. NPDC093970]|uniref:WXG100 family type VII secretion target n=1 Tax=Streptomyces sp. NPDC093970 TaxID=3155076 RepID=UPI00343E1876